MCKKQTLLIVFFCSGLLYAYAQTPQLYFEKLTKENGLSHNKVNCIIQDKRGFIWIGTDDGLNRFDGHNFLKFHHQPENPYSISGNIITGLLEDENEVLWIITADGGLSRYNHRLSPKNQWKQFKHNPVDSNSIPVNIINAIAQDKYGNLWLGSSGFSVLRFNKKTERFDKPVLKGTRTILSLAFDANGILWVGRQGGGILKLNPADFSYEMDERYSNLYAKLPHAAVSSLFTDSEKNIWFGSWDKVLYRYDFASKKEIAYQQLPGESFVPNDEILSFAEDRYKKLWMGTRNIGLTVYDKIEKTFYNYRHNPAREGSIADNRVNCVFIDRAGMIWLGTNKGISISNPAQQQFQQTFLFLPQGKSFSQIQVYDFYKDPEQNLWIGSNEGIFLQKANEAKFTHIPLFYNGHKLSVTKFFYDDDSRALYLGTDYSLFLYNPSTNTVEPLPNTENDLVMSRLIESRIVSIIKDSIEGKPVLLVSPYGHYISYYDLYEKRWVSRLDTVRKILQRFNLKDNLVRKFYKTSSGKIWLATAREGLGEWINNSLPKVHYLKNNPNTADGISNNHVYDITEDRQRNLWLSTYGGGLHYFNTSTKKIIHISAANNLLEGLQVDKSENVWMISNGHLHRYDHRQKTYTSFELPDIEKSGGIKGYIYKDNEGKMYVAGTNYFIAFNPDSIKVQKNTPKVFFTDFKIFNTSYSDLLSADEISLRYNQNYFTIEFAAPDFSSGNLHYSYKLEGWDKDWVDIGTRNFIPYSNLEGGNYILKVRATKNPGIWNNEIASIKIEIVPPVWKRWWFFALCAVLVSVIVYGVYRYRINEILKRQAIRNKIAQDLHDNVGSTLSSISVYSQVAKIYHDRQQQNDLQQTLEKIGSTSSDMISEMNDIVWSINPRNDSMEKIIQRMESFARPLLAAKKIAFDFNYDKDIINLNLEMEKRKNFYLIFKEAINNVLKYSAAGKLTVNVAVKNNQLNLLVKDDGVGFDALQVDVNASQSLSGNGLRNMVVRAKEMKGDCIVQSAIGKGTTVDLRFPIT